MKILKVRKEFSSTTPDGPLATIPDISHAKALHTWTQLLQGRVQGDYYFIYVLLASCVRGEAR